MTILDDPFVYGEMRTCFDCLDEEPVFGYVPLENGELAPVCQKCFLLRQREAERRINELPGDGG